MKLCPPAIGLSLLLTGCGAFPQPFAENPGATALRLSVPPPSRLVIIPPHAALLGDAEATAFAQDVADALADRAVPAIIGGSEEDWRLIATAETVRNQVLVTYTVDNPKGVPQGSTTAPPIAAATWARPLPAALKLVAARDAPAIASLLDRINAAAQDSDPNSLVNRPARLAWRGVTGAPGDGNRALHQQMVAELTDLGIVVQETPKGADYSVSGTVKLVPAGVAGQSRVEIQWTVNDVHGHEAGHLLQMNDVPDGSLDGHWGDVAVVVAQEAAGGVREVMLNQTASHRLGSARPKTAAAQPHPPRPPS